MFLCQVCNNSHKCSKKFHGHDVVPLGELKSKKNICLQPTTPVCKKHNIQLLFFCETCDQLMCLYCTVMGHMGHNHETVKKMADKHRQGLKEITAPLEEMIAALAEVYNNVFIASQKEKEKVVEM